MAKSLIEKPPFKFEYQLYNTQDNLEYLQKYRDVDKKGRYLYWDKFKYRVDKGDDVKRAWWATKFVRFSKSKPIDYRDKSGDIFIFCIPDTLQAKLYKISHLASQGIVPYNSIKKHYLISSLMMEEAISSSQLEGVSTTRKVANFIHPIIKAIILHFMIAYEHPFADGNGRTARAIFYWYMLKSGYDYFEYVSISKLLKKAPKQYGLSFLYSEIDNNDLTYFIDYQLDIILRAIDELLSYLEEKSREFQELNIVLDNSSIGNSLNFIEKDILKKAIKHPARIFTAKEIANSYNKSLNSARKYLNQLVELKVLAIIKNGRTKEYIALSDILEKLKR